MNTKVIVEMLSVAAAIAVAALSYLFAKWKERESDWRKWKYEQYKEFIIALSENVGPPDLETHRTFLKACNTVTLIGSPGVLTAIHMLIESMNADNPREENNAWISKLIWEIRKDLQIPGTPKEEEFSVRLWFPIERATKNDKRGFTN